MSEWTARNYASCTCHIFASSIEEGTLQSTCSEGVEDAFGLAPSKDVYNNIRGLTKGEAKQEPLLVLKRTT